MAIRKIVKRKADGQTDSKTYGRSYIMIAVGYPQMLGPNKYNIFLYRLFEHSGHPSNYISIQSVEKIFTTNMPDSNPS